MSSLDELLDLYARWGWHHYDEQLAQAEHALQTAARAEAAGAPDALVAAALLHDVGHLLALDRQADAGPHERTGADYLTHLFSADVTDPVAHHVEAKRYLCAVEPGYAALLSTGSVRSLQRQGGPMTNDEVAAFERVRGCAASVALRRWDDAGKSESPSPRTIDSYRPLLMSLLSPDGQR